MPFTKKYEQEILKSISWFLSVFFIIKMSTKEKFAQNLQGPYMVLKVLFGGSLVLSEMDGTVWPKPFNLDAVKTYYV